MYLNLPTSAVHQDPVGARAWAGEMMITPVSRIHAYAGPALGGFRHPFSSYLYSKCGMLGNMSYNKVSEIQCGTVITRSIFFQIPTKIHPIARLFGLNISETFSWIAAPVHKKTGYGIYKGLRIFLATLSRETIMTEICFAAFYIGSRTKAPSS